MKTKQLFVFGILSAILVGGLVPIHQALAQEYSDKEYAEIDAAYEVCEKITDEEKQNACFDELDKKYNLDDEYDYSEFDAAYDKCEKITDEKKQNTCFDELDKKYGLDDFDDKDWDDLHSKA